MRTRFLGRLRAEARCRLKPALLAFLLFSGGALAATLTGVVEDATGSPVPNAQLKLRHKATGQEFSSKSDEAGQFTFDDVPVGGYFMRARAKGFEEAQAPVSVGATPSRPVRLRLELAERSDEVTVTAEAPVVGTAEQNLDALEMDQNWFRNLPAKEGDPLAVPMLFVNPAANGVSGPKIIVDGVESSALEVPTSTIKRLTVNKNPYSAEFSRPGSGRIEVTTKKGVHNRYRGSISQLLRNSALDARNAFAAFRPPMQREITEAQLDGPLGKNLVFFVAGRRYSDNESAYVNAQTLAGRLVQSVPAPEQKTYLYGRFDYRLNPTNKLTARYKFKDSTKRNQGLGGFNLAERATDQLDREHEVKLYEQAVLSPATMNEVRVTFRQRPQATNSLSGGPATIVLDAFSSGGAQVSLRQRENAADIQDLVTYIRGRHSFKFGGGFRPRFFDARNASNFAGTFTFSSLAAFAQNRPVTFTQNVGDPDVSYHRQEIYSFVHDEIRLGPGLSLTAGLRHEFQSNVPGRRNFAPRLALAYAPGARRTVLRVGAGIFYDRQPEVMDQQALLYDGSRIRQLVISNPGLESAVRFPAPGVMRIASDIRVPYLVQASGGVERLLSRSSSLAVEYTSLRGVGLYRLRNINAPLPATGARPDPRFTNVNQFESSGRSRSNSLALTYRTQLRALSLMSQYTFSRARDDTSGMFSLPADNWNLQGERGRSDFDRRHRLVFLGMLRLPAGFRSSAVASLNSGMPFNLTTGLDDNHDTVVNDRPPGVGRNTGRGPGFASLDARLSKEFVFRKEKHRPNVEVGMEAFNLANRVNFKNYIGTLTSPFFGRANAALPARQMQASMKFNF